MGLRSNHSKRKSPKKGTKRRAIAIVLLKGATAKEIAKETGATIAQVRREMERLWIDFGLDIRSFRQVGNDMKYQIVGIDRPRRYRSLIHDAEMA